MFVDSHCHLLDEYYDSKEKIIDNAKKNKINKIIVSGYNLKSNKEIINNIKKYNELYGTIGIHPNNYKEATEEDLNYIERNLNEKKIIAIGEIGLDYHYEGFDKERQKLFFEKQLKLAIKYKMPVVIHCRDATEDMLKILKKYNLKGVIHSFTENEEVALEYIKLNLFLGINGVITFKNNNLINVIKKVGIKNIVLETDAPYLTPVPYRGKKNESKNIIYIAKFLSDNLNYSMDDISKITSNNIKKIFDI